MTNVPIVRTDRRNHMGGPIFDSRRLHYSDRETAEDSAPSDVRCPSGDQRRGFTIQARNGRFHLYVREAGRKVYRGAYTSRTVAEVDGRAFAAGYRHRSATKIDIDGLCSDILDAVSSIDIACGPSRPPGYVYAVRSCGLVKIGRCDNPYTRLRGMQMQSAAPVVLVGIVHGADRERYWHDRLSEHRAHGEWFSIDEPPFILSAVGSRCMACDGALWPKSDVLAMYEEER